MTTGSTVTEKPVCVTGASGFIGSQIIRELLGAGYRVRAAVRDAEDPQRCGFLRELPGARERLETANLQLLDPQTCTRALRGCEFAIHTASPYVIDVADPLRELVEPAVQGTLNILRASIAAGLRRVVITSSAGAVTDEPRTGRTYDESQWSESTSLTRNPYYYSKRLAEQQAWSFAAADPGLDVVAILPSLVLGPSLCPSLNTSNRILRDLLCGAYPAVLDIGWVLVDVRDVATAHVRAMEAEGAKGRYLCANKTVTAAEIVALLRELGYDRYKLPRFRLDSRIGTSIARFAAHFQPKGTRSYLKTHLGQTPAFDNSKIRRDLDVAFRPVRQTLRDAVESLIEWGHVDKRP